jgi:hypothetical protein
MSKSTYQFKVVYLGIGYDMGIYLILIPKIPNFLGYILNNHTEFTPKKLVFGCEYWGDTQQKLGN